MTRPIRNGKIFLTLTVGLVLSGCAGTTGRQGVGETDDFLKAAFDAYGVIDVAPAAPRQARATTAPLDARTPAATTRTFKLSEVCAGKTGIQRGYQDQATGKPIDCGPGKSS